MNNPQQIAVGDTVYQAFSPQQVADPETFEDWNKAVVIAVHEGMAWVRSRYRSEYEDELCSLESLYKEPPHVTPR